MQLNVEYHGSDDTRLVALATARWRRWLLAAVVIVFGAAGATAIVAGARARAAAGSAPAAAGRAPAVKPVVLPRDHGAHPGFGVEWWYTAGTLTGAKGRDYFWFATLWSAGGEAVAKVNVVDLRADRVILSHEYVGAEAFRAGQTRLAVQAFRLSWRAGGSRGTWSIDGPVTPAGGLALHLTPVQPYVLHGHQGIIRQGPGGPSAYYSAPRVAARGTLEVDGRALHLTGQGWLDHQWGNFSSDPGALRWNWFACQFRDGSDLMLYQFLNADDRPSGIRAGTLVSGDGKVTHLSRFTVVPLRPIIRPAGATTSYPLRWRLTVPAGSLDLTLKARARNQFIVNQFVPSFWEGAAAITHGLPGACIVESSRQVGAAS